MPSVGSSRISRRGRLAAVRAPDGSLIYLVDKDATGKPLYESDYWNELNNSLTRYLEELELTRERVGHAGSMLHGRALIGRA